MNKQKTILLNFIYTNRNKEKTFTDKKNWIKKVLTHP